MSELAESRAQPRPILEPLTAGDLDEVAAFLHAHMNSRITVRQWRDSFRTPWENPGPNYGYGLRAHDSLVGVYTAIYSMRIIDGSPERFCNLAAWCVMPEYRMHSFLLLKRQLAHREYHMTDLSPRADVANLMRRFGFQDLDAKCWIVPNVPRTGTSRIVTDLDAIAAALPPLEQAVFQDHRTLGPIDHALIEDDEAPCHLVYQRTKKRGMPCAVVLHVSAPKTLGKHYGIVGAHLLRKAGAAFTIYETRMLGRKPRFARDRTLGAKLYRSESLAPDKIDNLYSELVTLPVVASG